MYEKDDREKYFVAVGASAGGLKALTSFITHLSPDLGYNYIVAQHASPDRASLLMELLDEKTDLNSSHKCMTG